MCPRLGHRPSGSYRQMLQGWNIIKISASDGWVVERWVPRWSNASEFLCVIHIVRGTNSSKFSEVIGILGAFVFHSFANVSKFAFLGKPAGVLGELQPGSLPSLPIPWFLPRSLVPRVCLGEDPACLSDCDDLRQLVKENQLSFTSRKAHFVANLILVKGLMQNVSQEFL